MVSPWEELAGMHRQMDEIFSRAFGFTPLSRLLPSETLQMPDIDIYEKDDKVIVQAVVPGFTTSDIKVEATPDFIHLEGERKSETEAEDMRQHQRSKWSSFTRFQATLPLPTEIDPSKVNAKLENGVLKLELPKSEQARQKSVRINIKGP